MPPTAAALALPKQTLDYIEHPDGSITAVMTVTFSDGTEKRFETLVTPEDVHAVAGEFVGAEMAINPDSGEVGSFFGNIAKGIGKAVKAVASSKIMKIAATGLAIASPILGPFAPAALAASAGLGIASKLASASHAAASGALEVAKSLTASAKLDASALTLTAGGAASLLKAANAKRIAATNIAPKKAAPAKPKAAPKLAAAKPIAAKPAAAKVSASTQSESDLLERARAGRVRSNQAGTVTDAQLLAAHSAGRIFWVL